MDSKLFDNLDLMNGPNIIHFNLFNSQQNYLERFDCYSRRGSFYNILSDRWQSYNLQSPDFSLLTLYLKYCGIILPFE